MGTRRVLLRWASALAATLGLGPWRAAATQGSRASAEAVGRLRELPLRDIRRIDAAEDTGWWARDGAGRLWQVPETGPARLFAEGLDPASLLAQGHGRIAARGLDGRLWVHEAARPASKPARSDVPLAPHGGLCVLPLAIIAVVEEAAGPVLARFEPDAGGTWRVVARSREPVLPDAVPVAVDLDGAHGGAHIAVLAGPDAQRYPHAVLGDGIEATRLLWLERHSLEALRTLQLAAPEVFEDRLLRPWQLPDGRTGLVTVRAGPQGAQLVVVAAARNSPADLETAAAGPAIGTRNRWLSPASVGPADPTLWAVHTPHIGGVLHRYRAEGAALVAERVAERVAPGLTNHRLGARELDISARVGPWLLLPTQNWRGLRAVHTQDNSNLEARPEGAPIEQCVASASRRSALLLSASGLAVFTA